MILPVAMKQEKMMAKTILNCKAAGVKNLKEQKEHLNRFSQIVEKAIKVCKDLEIEQKKAEKVSFDKRAKLFCTKILPIHQEFRKLVDEIESIVDDNSWPLPKYRELLFLL